MSSIKLNKKSIAFINQFKDNFLKAEKKWKNTYNIKYDEFLNRDFNTIPNIEHYEPSILDSFYNIPKKKCLFRFSTSTKNINIVLISPITKTDEQILSYMKLIFTWFHGIESHTTLTCSNELDIYIFLTPSIKLIPKEKYNPIGKKNANTAFTFTCRRKNVIHIFREEEWFKVLIHESFHNLNLDFSKYDHGYSDIYVQSLFPNRKDIRFYESYCEIWALLFHSLFYSLEHNTPLNKILSDELNFSFFQCAKILDHFNMKYTDFYTNSNKAILKRSDYKENTPILSYYFFKTIFLYHINDFLEWCSTENNKSIRFSKLPIHYIDIYQKIQNLIVFLENHYKSSAFLSTMKEQERKYQKDKKNIRLNDIYLFKTLKMSVHDLNDTS